MERECHLSPLTAPFVIRTRASAATGAAARIATTLGGSGSTNSAAGRLSRSASSRASAAMESKGEYVYDSQSVAIVHVCPKCGAILGHLVPAADGRAILDTGSVAVYTLHGYCQCGAQVHFTSGDWLLSDILARRNRVRRMEVELQKSDV